jgi:hypothetical protein|tara:strand:+ start:57 stop:800 length:744 start_codon:yes stop_codon:yes gene_type:complete
MHGLSARTARRGNQITLTQGDPLTMILDLPATDSFGSGSSWSGQRGHVLIRLPAPAPAVGARRTVEWQLTQSDRNGTTVTRGKIGSSNDVTLIEPSRQGGAVLPIFGGFRLEVAPYNCPFGATMAPEAYFSVGDGPDGIGNWETSYPVAVTSAVPPATAGPWTEIGPPPFGATRVQIQAPNVLSDAAAPGPLELEWVQADGTTAARDFFDAASGIRIAPQGFHARIRTSGAYGGSGFTARCLVNWSR